MEKAIKRYFPIFVLPTFLAFIIGFIAPFAEGIWLSFCDFTTINDAKWVGLANYIKIMWMSIRMRRTPRCCWRERSV